jgi:hypothetical protein
MSDRELLEAAAKAAGIKIEHTAEYACAQPGHFKGGFSVYNDKGGSQLWNPLTDDGDALRLAVKLRISLIHEEEHMGGSVIETIEAMTPPLRSDGLRHCEMLSINDLTDDEMANVRRVIVRAAAALPPSPLPHALYGQSRD